MKYNNIKDDKIMVEKVYLWIKSSLKFTFDIIYFLKSISNKIEKGFISVYKTNEKYHCVIVTSLHTYYK